jgi:hypothetical protein
MLKSSIFYKTALKHSTHTTDIKLKMNIKHPACAKRKKRRPIGTGDWQIVLCTE